jgi:hypothetical protein
MSAKHLCDALSATGFDGADPLDPESLEWAFLQGDDSRRMYGLFRISDGVLYIPVHASTLCFG